MNKKRRGKVVPFSCSITCVSLTECLLRLTCIKTSFITIITITSKIQFKITSHSNFDTGLTQSFSKLELRQIIIFRPQRPTHGNSLLRRFYFCLFLLSYTTFYFSLFLFSSRRFYFSLFLFSSRSFILACFCLVLKTDLE